MPPQPLSSVRRDARPYLAADIIVKQQPELAALAAGVIAHAAHIENLFGAILTTMLGANAAPAAAMFRALTSMNAQADVLAAAAEVVLDPVDQDLLGVLTALCEKAAKHRHRLAHWAWAGCFELPDAIILIDPEGLLEYELNTNSFMSPNEGRGLGDDFDPKWALVYRKKDLEEAVAALNRAHMLLSVFRTCVVPFVREEPRFRDPQYPRLLAQPEIAEALAKLAEARKSNPSAQARGRRKGPRGKK